VGVRAALGISQRFTRPDRLAGATELRSGSHPALALAAAWK
jgi:hypothetical protein